ncbi:MAG: glycoside hydrolase family 78 protein [Clostridium sp.]|nr:glycoside hydrolase family 78 protein [Clostridium sp.]
MTLSIKKLFVEYQEHPLGLDEASPRFSWLLVSDGQNVLQTACQIRITAQDGPLQNKCVWDSGTLNSDVSTGISYMGEPLAPCTAYQVDVTVWDNHGNAANASTFFETGLMDETGAAFEGAQWIGAPRYTVCASNRGVFVLETELAIPAGKGRAGVVFGANDFRLLDHTKNELGLEGENYIRFELNLLGETPKLDIYRVGYAPEDKADAPFASVDLVNFEGESKTPVITAENAGAFHTLRIEVDGNNSLAYVDDILVDAVMAPMPMGGARLAGRTLNPRGFNDVLTYPRLNEIGFFAGENCKAQFKYLKVKNMRHPSNAFICETPGGNLYGEKSLFDGKVRVKDGFFVVENEQITADPSNTSIPMLRTNLTISKDKELAKARLYITSRGVYECMVNGQAVTERLLPPGITQYDRRLNYQTYDITPFLASGENGIGVTLASGWWSEAQTFVVKNFNYFGDKESLLAKIVLIYQDGSTQTKVTNIDDWKYFGDGPYTYAGFFAGEHFDAGKADIYENYSKKDFDDSKWEAPAVVTPVPIAKYRSMPPGFGRSWPAVNEGSTKLIGEYDAPIYIVDSRAARSRKKLEEGVYIYDLEQEMAGVPKIIFHEKAGTKVIIRYAEVLYPDMPEYEGKIGTMMLENYRDATSTDVYICSGKDGEVYQPKFTFHGYHYIEISGVSNPPALEEVVSLQYSSIKEFDGSFTSSNKLLNRFAQNVSWSQKCNFINIPTDCPQRNERMGWAGDTHVFCHTALNNSDLKQFYERNLQAMADLQTVEGQFPEIAPLGGGFGGITYECASIFMAWELYQQYGDIRTLERFYPGMKKYMDYMKDKGLPGKGNFAKVGPLGDWLAPEETDLQLLWNAFYYREADLMSKISALLGKDADAEEFSSLAKKVKAFWNETFIDPESKKTRTMEGQLCDTQCSYVLGLKYGVMKDKKAAAEHLLRKTRALNHTVGTGFFGTGLLNQALTETGAVEDAYKLMLQTQFPSWLYPVTQGATTIWEHWDSYTEEKGFGGQNAMNSFNHYSLGSVLSWMYHTILGIQRDESVPGYKKILLKPEIGPLEFAKGSVASPHGKISAGWKKADGKVVYACEIPVNTSATLSLPDGTQKEIGSGKWEFEF